MFKSLIFLAITSISIWATNIVVVTDIAQGITKSEGMEVMTLIQPKKKSPLYEDEGGFYGYVFTEKGRKNANCLFDSSNRHTIINLKNKCYKPYFNVVKSGVQKTSIQKNKAKDILFLVDTSGSMKKSINLNSLKNKLKQFVESKDKNVHISLVTFDGHPTFNKTENARILLEFTKDKNIVNNAIDEIKYTNFSTMYDVGLKKSLEAFNGRNVKDKILYFISDGIDPVNMDNALKIKKELEYIGVEIQPFPFGGERIDILKQFSSSGGAYGATRADMESNKVLTNMNNNTIFEKLSAVSNATLRSKSFKKHHTKDDVMIIYSTMMEKSKLYDFYMEPNIAYGPFKKDVNAKLKKEGINIDFQGIKVYVRLIGDPSDKEERKLRGFWEEFINTHNGKLESFSKNSLTLEEMGY